MGQAALYLSGKGGVDILKKLKWNSKWIALAICMTAVAALSLGLGLHIYRIHRLPACHVQITGAAIDNDYNNFISEFDLVNDTGDLVRIGDKLYYNYYGSYASYGLYEISHNHAQRIYWDGYGPYAFLIGYSYELYPIREYNGKLLMNTIMDGKHYVYNNTTKEWELAQERIQTYSEETQDFEEALLFGGISDIYTLTYQETSFGFVYESAERHDLWVYTEEGGSEKISSEVVLPFYTVGEQIYYTTIATPSSPLVLHVFDWEKKTDAVICQWTDYTNMRYFIIEGNNLIFVANDPAQNTQSVYTYDLSDTSQKELPIYSIDRTTPDYAYISSWNVWNGTVYLCTTKGLIAIDLDTGIHSVLCDKATLECDIVDDTWVYFLEEDNLYLWRVRKSGGKAELVLG